MHSLTIYNIRVHVIYFCRFYNMTANGCTTCGCDPDGSGGSLCDVTTGACTCKPRVQGDKCDTCKESKFTIIFILQYNYI